MLYYHVWVYVEMFVGKCILRNFQEHLMSTM